MAVIAERTVHVVGLPEEHGGSGDPSPVTASGVESAMRACARSASAARTWRAGASASSASGTSAAGSRRLLAAGAELIVTDVEPASARSRRSSAPLVDPREAIAGRCDVLAPCALGGAIDAATVEGLRCRIVCGSANNVLTGERLAERAGGARDLFAPDFIANAGGLINVYGELHHLDRARSCASSTRSARRSR